MYWELQEAVGKRYTQAAEKEIVKMAAGKEAVQMAAGKHAV